MKKVILRDELNTFNMYEENIEFNKEIIMKRISEINTLIEDEKNGVQRYPKKNIEVIQSMKETIYLLQRENLLSIYSAGYPLSLFKEQYLKTLDIMLSIWDQRGGYINFIDMYSISVLLGLKESQEKLILLFEKTYYNSKFKINDFLIDFLFYPNANVTKYPSEFLIKKPYSTLKDVIEWAYIDKEKAIERLKSYLKDKWFNELKKQDLICETHKLNSSNHYGYWSFESGALVKILGLNDSILKEQKYYPYDLVHYDGKE